MTLVIVIIIIIFIVICLIISIIVIFGSRLLCFKGEALLIREFEFK